MSFILHDVALSYGDQQLFSHVHFELHASERVALLGRNGSGKTTLLRLLEGSLSPTAGKVSRTGSVAYLPQLGELPSACLQEAVRPARLAQAWADFQHWERQLAQGTPEVLEGFLLAEETWRTLGGYDFEQRAREALDALDLNPMWTTSQLSGGQRRRALLAQLLLTPADTYLLDEPTNHLDWPSLEWLETWVAQSSAAFLIVSHDRAFLDATVTRCVELEHGALHEYAGNYTQAMEAKATLRAARERQYQAHRRKAESLLQEQRRIAQQAASTDRYNHKRKKPGNKMSAKNRAQDVARTLARRAQALEKRLERMEAPERLLKEKNLVQIQLSRGEHGPNEVLRLADFCIWRGEKIILDNVNLHVRRGEKIAVIGPNGGGKSTLLGAILGQHAAAGELRLADMSMQWAGQNHEELSAYATLQDALLAANPELSAQHMYEALARLGLPRQLEHRLCDLSGGQQTRLALARLSLSSAQLLLLDEPTNHLDHAAIEALQLVLERYTGTLIFASHDRELVSRVATRHWWVEAGQVTDLGEEWPAEP